MIHIITTGGTIEGLDYENPENNLEQSKITIREFLDSANVSFPYIIEKAFAKDSRSITDEDRMFLLKKIILYVQCVFYKNCEILLEM